MAKAKPFKLAVVTANHLRSGAVLFRTPSGWSEQIDDAAVADSPEAAEALLVQAKADPIALDVVLIDVTQENGVVTPVSLRERIRANGPTAETKALSESAHVPL
jgi:hypothetical protein